MHPLQATPLGGPTPALPDPPGECSLLRGGCNFTKTYEWEHLAGFPVHRPLQLGGDVLEELLELLPVKLPRGAKDERELSLQRALLPAHDLEAVFDQNLVVRLRRLDEAGRINTFHDHAMDDACV